MKRLALLALLGLLSACDSPAKLAERVDESCLAFISVEKGAVSELARAGFTPEQYCGCYGAEVAALGMDPGKLHLEILQQAILIRDTEAVDGQEAIRQVRQRADKGEMPFTEAQVSDWDEVFDNSFDVLEAGKACGTR